MARGATAVLAASSALALIPLGFLVPPAATAQQAVDHTDDAIEEIIVTGSRLIRRDFTAPSPIRTIDRETILASGQPTLEDALNKLPQVQPSSGRATNNGGDGRSQIDLRGIGAGRTLVMLNGRRVAPSGIGSAVDVNTLPGVLVERVEVITGGATTVYGSDAIAGVVNFITRDDFEGFGLESSYYSTQHGDSDVFDLAVTWGRNFDNGNIAVFGNYLDRESLFSAERSFAARALNDNWFTGNLEPGGSPTTPAGVMNFPRVDFGNGPARTTWDSNGDPREFLDPEDRYDFAPVNYLQVPLERVSAGILFDYHLDSDVELYSELTFSNNQAVENGAPTATFQRFVEINTDNPLLTAANRQFLMDNAIPLGPGRVGFGLERRLLELGPRITEYDNDYTRMLAGLRGELSPTWDYDVWITYTRGEETRWQRNDASFSRLQQGLLVDPATGACFDASTGCVPLNVFGEGRLSEAGADFVRADPYLTRVDREQKLVSAFIRVAPFELPAGDLSAAIGIEWREDSGDLIADEALFTGDTLGYRADSNVVGEESVSEIYAEALLPVLRDRPLARFLGLELGGRLSNYDKAGELETWKLGADWEPLQGLRFRAMFQRSARAPNLREAFLLPFEEPGTAIFVDSREDPCSASADPIGSGLSEVCTAQGIPPDELGVYEATVGSPVTFTFGGNARLAPEIAETLTAGIVLTTFDAWTIAIDYFELDVEDTIGQSDPMLVCWDPANTERVTCNSIARDPVTFDIDRVDQTNANLGKLRTSGFDTQFEFGAELSGWAALGAGVADLDVSIIWTHVTENSVQGDPASTVFECAGTFGFACDFFGNDTVFPENRIASNVAWRAAGWRAQLAWRRIEGTRTSAREGAAAFGVPPEFVTPAIESIGSKSYFDLAVSHDVTRNLTVGLTVANLLDEDPPIIANNGNRARGNTDAEMYDVFGRAYTLRLALTY